MKDINYISNINQTKHMLLVQGIKPKYVFVTPQVETAIRAHFNWSGTVEKLFGLELIVKGNLPSPFVVTDIKL